MKVLIYKGSYEIVKKSGVGRAMEHQIQALEKAGIGWTQNPGDDYDIIHINTVFPDAVRMARRARRQGKKVVYYGHSTMEDFKNSFKGSNLMAPLFKQWIKSCYSLGDVIITPTEYSKGILQGYGIKKPMEVLSNGINLEEYQRNEHDRREFREYFQLNPEEKTVIAVGHYIERKGILDFMKLAERFPQYKFIWFGYTDPRLIPGKIKRAIQRKRPNLILPGYLDKAELKKAYAGADLFLFPTWEETEGIVLLEAMAARIPVLVRNIAIYKKWLADGTEVYKADDREDFADKLEQIVSGRLPDLTPAAYEKVQKNSIEQVGMELKEIYWHYFQRSVSHCFSGDYAARINHKSDDWNTQYSPVKY